MSSLEQEIALLLVILKDAQIASVSLVQACVHGLRRLTIL